jgi:hypothetical protein
MRHNTKKGRTPFKSKRHGKTRRVQRGGALVKDADGNTIGEYNDKTREGRAVYPGVGVYEGHFNENGVPDGQGTLTYVNEDVYTGAWVNDMPRGHGVMTFASGDVYDGGWVDNEMSGRGVMTFASGRVYDGEWLNDEFNGHGIMRYANGREYNGQWANDERNGKGKLSNPDGSSYDGDWANDEMHGQGTYKFENGDVYVGELREGNFSGTGTMRYEPRGVYKGEYKGEWSHDVRHGYGVLTYADGREYKGEWANDQRVYDNVGIARTTDEFMAMCLTATKTEVECRKETCPLCLDEFIDEGNLLWPVMFHNTVTENGEFWSCPVHLKDQIKAGTKCTKCRAELFLTKEQINEQKKPYATKLQSVIRGRQTRKKIRRAKNLAAFNALIPPRSVSRTRSNRHSANF